MVRRYDGPGAFTAERYSRTRGLTSGRPARIRRGVVVRVGPLFSEWAAPCSGCPPEAIATQTIGARSGASRGSRAAQRTQRWPPQVDATFSATPPTGLAGPALLYDRQEACLQRSSGNASPTLNPCHRLHIGSKNAVLHSAVWNGTSWQALCGPCQGCLGNVTESRVVRTAGVLRAARLGSVSTGRRRRHETSPWGAHDHADARPGRIGEGRKRIRQALDALEKIPASCHRHAAGRDRSCRLKHRGSLLP